jgi:hypothetical protein
MMVFGPDRLETDAIFFGNMQQRLNDVSSRKSGLITG